MDVSPLAYMLDDAMLGISLIYYSGLGYLASLGHIFSSYVSLPSYSFLSSYYKPIYLSFEGRHCIFCILY